MVSEELNSVETIAKTPHYIFIIIVSEGLNSVETYKITINRKGIGKFQKNLVVWKPFVLTEPVWMPSRFQKNLVVWKRKEGGGINVRRIESFGRT